MKGLIFVLSICMGLSFGKVAKGWAIIVGGNFFMLLVVQNSFVLLCIADGAKLFCVVDVGSWHLSCRCSKSLLSNQTNCVMA